MARVIKEHAVRRGEILDVAQRLVYSKGYEQMTVQDILDGLQISKGAFYHYFGSKPALLEALIERMLGEGTAPHTHSARSPPACSRKTPALLFHGRPLENSAEELSARATPRLVHRRQRHSTPK